MDIEKFLNIVYSEEKLQKALDDLTIYELIHLYGTIEIEPTYHRLLTHEIISRLIHYSDISADDEVL